jgi:transposase
MDIIKDRPQVSRMEVVDTGRRRRWSAEKKLEIVEESFAVPRMAAATARRHGISPSLLFAWRKAYREGRLEGSCGFVPAVILPDAAAEKHSEPEVPPKRRSGGRMTVVCANGRRVIVGPDVDGAALARVLAVLEGAGG